MANKNGKNGKTFTRTPTPAATKPAMEIDDKAHEAPHLICDDLSDESVEAPTLGDDEDPETTEAPEETTQAPKETKGAPAETKGEVATVEPPATATRSAITKAQAWEVVHELNDQLLAMRKEKEFVVKLMDKEITEQARRVRVAQEAHRLMA